MLILGFAALGIWACGSQDNEVRDKARQEVEANTPAPPANNPAATPATPAAPAASATGVVHHYICPNNCEGSGGDSQGVCPVCGTAYVHNQAFHNQQQPATQINPTQTPPTPSAEKNAAGEWHYVCSANCGGGAGAQGSCPLCGAPLTHNAAYHN
ncbi:MAG: hypothetical protein D6765_16450 [Bacteroidetes bacterium]|nr:MAG: hypothetical protein D6765_16450 [Bacteroidota bacterium]